jgi:hypothetical protein
MKCNLSPCGLNVIPDDVLEGVWEESKEDTLASMVAKFATMRARWADPDTTTKGAEVAKVGFGTVAFFKQGLGSIFSWQGIFDPKVVVESIGQKRASRPEPVSMARSALPMVWCACLTGPFW